MGGDGGCQPLLTMPFSLGPLAPKSGYRLIAHETIDSTSAEAVRLALDGDAGRVWIVAGEQTEGHGRRGRTWHTPNGNLAASLLMPLQGDDISAATLGFVAGLALHGAIRAIAPALADGLRLKWPNDVLIGSAKVAGVLLEAVSAPAMPNGVVIGIGVNVRHAPVDLPYPAISLADCGADVTAEELFEALAEAWVEQERRWDGGRGFADIRDLWLARAAGLGTLIVVQLGGDLVRGTFETIDPEGRLVVRARDGSARTVSAGDVYFGSAGSAGL